MADWLTKVRSDGHRARTEGWGRGDGVETHYKAHAGEPTAEEQLARYEFVLSLMQAGVSGAGVVKAGRERFGCTADAIRRIRKGILDEWKTAFESEQPHEKCEQVERIRLDLTRLRSQAIDAEQRKAPTAALYATIAKLETLYARITGTLEPVKVKVDTDAVMGEALATVLADLSPEEREQAIRDQLDLEDRARAVLH